MGEDTERGGRPPRARIHGLTLNSVTREKRLGSAVEQCARGCARLQECAETPREAKVAAAEARAYLPPHEDIVPALQLCIVEVVGVEGLCVLVKRQKLALQAKHSERTGPQRERLLPGRPLRAQAPSPSQGQASWWS